VTEHAHLHVAAGRGEVYTQRPENADRRIWASGDERPIPVRRLGYRRRTNRSKRSDSSWKLLLRAVSILSPIEPRSRRSHGGGLSLSLQERHPSSSPRRSSV
jgi:hypothetical protein